MHSSSKADIEQATNTYWSLVQYEYDLQGNRITEKRYLEEQSEGSAKGKMLVIRTEYDRMGRPMRIRDSIGAVEEYQYNEVGLLQIRRSKINKEVTREEIYEYTPLYNF